jgi:hypothetical protein
MYEQQQQRLDPASEELEAFFLKSVDRAGGSDG